MSLPICPLPSLSLPRCELTDIPRLLCGCSEHTRWNAEFDYDDLELAEHEYLTAREKHPAFLSVVKTTAVKSLPEYQAEPWQQARNVAVPITGATCESCGNRPAGEAFVCPECLDDLRVHLGDVPGLLDDLDVLASREARVTTRPRESKQGEHTRWDHLLRADESGVAPGRMLAAKGYNRPLPVERAVKARDEIGNEVITAVRSVAEPRGVVIPPMDTRAASRWLLSHLSGVAMDPAGPDICRGLRAAHRHAQDVIDNVDEGIYIGICDDEKCRARMFADPEQPEHTCTTCGAVYDVGQRREAIRDLIRSSLITIPEVVERSTSDPATFGKRLHATQLRRWVEQGRLARAGVKSGDKGEVVLYRASDVMDLVQGG